MHSRGTKCDGVRFEEKMAGTLRQASQASGLSRRKLYGLIAEGRLRSIKIGKRRLVVWRSLQELLIG